MRKTPITVKLQYFPSKVDGRSVYKIVRIDGAPTVWHPKGGTQRLHLGDALDEYEAEKLSTIYKVITVL